MKVLRNIYLSIFIFIVSMIVFACSLFNYQLAPVSDDEEVIEVVIEKGTISDIGKTLYENGLIKSEFFFKVYVKLTGNTNLMAASYDLAPNMGTREIVHILATGKGANKDEFNITFKEGINMRKIASIISEKTNNSALDVYNLVSDYEYLNSLIDEYWFIGKEILDEDIYYALEGYLYPNTYAFENKDVSVRDIFASMLKETDKQLSKYKEEIESGSLTVHEILTMASIVELEALNSEDRKGVASVLYNRLDIDMSLGCDVTTYYAAKVDMGERDLYESEINDCNGYNTRCTSFSGLPIGPISNPSIEAIEAVLNPNETNDLYFVADINGDVYFGKTYNEHKRIINDLKQRGLWYNY